jgi:conjugative transfer signal peptidase TraF
MSRAGAAAPHPALPGDPGLPAPPRTTPPRRRPSARVATVALIGLLALGGATKVMPRSWQSEIELAPARLRFNLSASLPRGLYRLDPAPGRPALSPGDFVLTCPPTAFARLARARRYLPAGRCPGGTQPLGKLVLALRGDRLDVEPAGITLDGVPLAATAAAPADAAGRPLPRVPPGPRLVAPGTLWLISPHPRSLDSRYFGPVAAAQILGRLLPLLTLGGCDPAPLAAAIRRAHRPRPTSLRSRPRLP